jgi:hypothetical protein
MSLIIVGSRWLGNKTHNIHLASFFTIGRRSCDAGEGWEKKPLCKGINQVSSSPLNDLAPALRPRRSGRSPSRSAGLEHPLFHLGIGLWPLLRPEQTVPC